MGKVEKFEDVIAEQGRLIYTNVGVSMMPLVRQGRDVMIIERVPEELKWLDAVVFKRSENVYVMHRIMTHGKDPYIICGDNSLQLERVRKEQIIGILTGVIRNAGRKDEYTIYVDRFGYKVFSLVMWCSWPFRRLAYGVWHIIKRVVLRRK